MPFGTLTRHVGDARDLAVLLKRIHDGLVGPYRPSLDPGCVKRLIAQLRFRRMVVFPWWQRLSRRAEQWRRVAEGWLQRGALLPVGMGALDEKDFSLDGGGMIP